jgi:hypothetical protein
MSRKGGRNGQGEERKGGGVRKGMNGETEEGKDRKKPYLVRKYVPRHLA